MPTAKDSTAFHADFLDCSKFVIKACQPFQAKTKGKVERFNRYLRRSFYVPPGEPPALEVQMVRAVMMAVYQF